MAASCRSNVTGLLNSQDAILSVDIGFSMARQDEAVRANIENIRFISLANVTVQEPRRLVTGTLHPLVRLYSLGFLSCIAICRGIE